MSKEELKALLKEHLKIQIDCIEEDENCEDLKNLSIKIWFDNEVITKQSVSFC